MYKNKKKKSKKSKFYGYTDYERRILGIPPKKKKSLKQRKEEYKTPWFVEHKKYLKSKYWFDVRKMVIERDQVCQICNSDKNLHVHHLTYQHYKKEKEYLEDLQLLCKNCHDKKHSRK